MSCSCCRAMRSDMSRQIRRGDIKAALGTARKAVKLMAGAGRKVAPPKLGRAAR